MLTRSVGFLVGGFAVFLLHGSARATQNCETINSIAYCEEVDSLGYSGFDYSGEYPDVVNMVTNGDQCDCTFVPRKFSGPLGPLSEDLSLHVRGPISIKQIATYKLSKSAKAKREHLRRHGHGHMHKRNIETKVVTYATTIYTTVDPSGPTPGGDAPPAPKVHKEDTSSKPPKDTPSDTPTTGGWDRVSYYNSNLKTAQGLVFLNHFGGSASGVFDSCLGVSLSYANSAMTGAAAGPEVLDDITVPSGREFAVFSDKKCEGDECGYYRPGIPAYHGFDGHDRAFLLEFSMPRAPLNGGLSDDLPAIWLLNARTPRVAQFGIKGKHCACWPQCGEFDIFEALPGTLEKPARDMIKTHVHCDLQGSLHGCGGNRDYFDRPLLETIKIAAVLSGSELYVIKLHDKTSFDKVLPEKVLSECKKTDSIFVFK